MPEPVRFYVAESGRMVEWVPCSKHEPYRGSGHAVLGCRRCTLQQVPPKRIQLSRQRPWRVDNPHAVIVARPSLHGNPFAIGKTYFWVSVEGGPLERHIVTRADAVAAYRSWRSGALYAGVRDPEPLDDVRGRDLACWCPLDGPCHGDVILEHANR